MLTLALILQLLGLGIVLVAAVLVSPAAALGAVGGVLVYVGAAIDAHKGGD